MVMQWYIYNGVNHFERGQVSTSPGTGLSIPWTGDDDSDSGDWLAEVQFHEAKDNGGVRHHVKYARGDETEVLDLDGAMSRGQLLWLCNT